ncbi:MAG: pyridoxamine 5'-phosphate oxidase family protein [Candidatus Bathyarchaeota archaeon]|nr:pyridoxamine 5'-phosphate oxidase family protein [Candidatus Bathyarchaeota archaeon]
MKKKELTQSGLSIMEQILNRAEVGRLGLSDGATPYVIPLNFAYLNGKIGFHCTWEGKKLELIAQNPRCCFEVDEYSGEVSYHYDAPCHLDYDSVVATGTAHVEQDEEMIWQFFQALHAKYKEIYRKPVEEGGRLWDRKRLRECCCVVIDVEELTGRRERTVEGERSKIMWQHNLMGQEKRKVGKGKP